MKETNFMENSRKKFFYTLFIPYILLVISGVIGAFCGVSPGFFGDQTLRYGAEAFEISIVFRLIGFWFIWLFCLIAQIVLLIMEKIKNKGAIKNWIISMVVVYIIFTLLGYGLSFHA